MIINTFMKYYRLIISRKFPFATFSIIRIPARRGIVANSGMKTVQGVSKTRIVQTGFANSNTVKTGHCTGVGLSIEVTRSYRNLSM